jgi:hypothetical protein
MNSDMFNMFFAEEIIKEFSPELTVVNMTGVDAGHSNFTEYCNNMRKADYAVGRLWNTIQQTPGMANDTVMIVVPEIGRNAQHNSIVMLTDAMVWIIPIRCRVKYFVSWQVLPERWCKIM